MSGKKLPGKPKLPKVSTYMVARLELEGWLSAYSPTGYPVDSRKVVWEVCNNAIIAKQCERNNW